VLKRIPARIRGPTGPARAGGLALLSMNESPYPPLPSVGRAITDAVADLHRYPDDEGMSLREELASRYGRPVEQVALGAGSSELCLQAALATVNPGSGVVFASPSFPLYSLITQLLSGEPRIVSLREDRLDLEAMLAAVSPGTRLVYVCNPNNPTGTSVEPEALAAFLRAVPEDCLVVLDEAYREFAGPGFPDGLGLLDEHPNLLVLRTFSKAYGLAGLRLGYGVAAPEVIEGLRRTHLPYSVSRPALEAGAASLRAEGELTERVDAVIAERERLAKGLTALGYDPTPSDANFLWVRTPGSASLERNLLDHGVAIRSFADEAIRISVGAPEENALLLEVLGSGVQSPR
jgi:histidinol-phosphate aminotransferase